MINYLDGILKKQPGRSEVLTIDGKGKMRDECSDWPTILGLGMERIRNWGTTNPLTRKYPAPLPYGLAEGLPLFRTGEDASANDDIRIVADNIAEGIEQQMHETQEA